MAPYLPGSFGAHCGLHRAAFAQEAPEALFNRADAALYEAKRSGRDRLKLAA